MATSSKYQESDFQGIRFIKLQQTGQNFSDFADEFAQSLVRSMFLEIFATEYFLCTIKLMHVSLSFNH